MNSAALYLRSPVSAGVHIVDDAIDDNLVLLGQFQNVVALIGTSLLSELDATHHTRTLLWIISF